ncbi:hypothetical protein MKZ38_004569 [Zalerion maritima]|uniref:Transcription initiation factor TFIID subunit 2 n=1 Tax=Zalerion maritima TaxID=339359 RepID=A0AAD5RXV2_9PEZI|nr:hypothetical protein MKZ38_004569 [Zalerion maritima]
MNGLSSGAQDGESLNYPPGFDPSKVVPYVLLEQNVQLNVNFIDKSITGQSVISVILHSNDEDEIEIDARQCEIDISKITVGGEKAKATYVDPNKALEVAPAWNYTVEQHQIQLDRMKATKQHYSQDAPISKSIPCGCQPTFKSVKIRIPSADKWRRKGNARRLELERRKKKAQGVAESVDEESRSNSLVVIVVPFKLSNPKDGYHFVGLDALDNRYPHLYTRHSIEPGNSCAMFPTIDDRCSHATWKISVTVPKTLGAALGQPPSATANVNAENGDVEMVDAGGSGSRRTTRQLSEADKILEMTVVCSGMLSDESSTDTTKTMTFDVNLDHSVNAKYMGFAVGPFEHVDLWSGFRTEEDEEKIAGQGLKIHGYCLPGKSQEVENICGTLVACADHLMLAIGKYSHWDYSYKLCFVDDMAEDSVPLVAFALCNSSLLFDNKMIDRDIPVLRELVYGLAWQYSGICLLPDLPEDSWVIYGIAGFLTELAMQEVCGNNYHRFHIKTMADQLMAEDVDMPSLKSLGEFLHLGPEIVNFMKLKANLVMFILDKRLAKKKASKGLVRVINRLFMKVKSASGLTDAIEPRCVTSAYFQERCEKFADLSLEHFWAQWVEGSGCVKFELIQKFNKKRLCVELNVRQIHGPDAELKIQKESAFEPRRNIGRRQFWSKLKRFQHGLEADKIPTMFTGPMTIKIHEADGTPYEHTLEIREDPQKSSRFEIPYNTKYKRIKRNRRFRERMANNTTQSGSFEAAGEAQDDQVIYMLGDVLQSKQEMDSWDLRDWDESQEKAMDGESYEWIRFDADTEWICHTRSNMPSYMQISQLQQDRDVAAQQESLLYLRDEKPHPLAATFLVRTVMDRRYYWGIRTMAASLLTQENDPHIGLVGARYLMKAFQELFCFPDTETVRPNDFHDKRDYFLQCEIPRALSRIRDPQGNCPQMITEFILKQLRFNDNKQNYFSDTYYVATLIRALATSLIPGDPDGPIQKKKDNESHQYLSRLTIEQHEQRARDRELIHKCTEEIERFRRMDEWNPSYQRMWTIAALEAKQWLMKAGIIEKHPVPFLMYLGDESQDHIRAMALECLAELGYLFHEALFPVFIAMFCTIRSPYLRERLFQILCIALAGIALGEDELAKPPQPAAIEPAKGDVPMTDAAAISNGNNDPDADADDEPALVVIRSEDATMQNKIDRARIETIKGALSALKAEVQDHTAIRKGIWKVITSSVLGWFERERLLDLCSNVFPTDYSLITTIQYPLRWKYVGKSAQPVNAKNPRAKSLVLTFSSYYKTKKTEKKPVEPEAIQPPPPPKPGLSRTISITVKQPTKVAATPKPQQPTPKPAAEPKAPKPSKISMGKDMGGAQQPSRSSAAPPTPKAQPPADMFSLRPDNPRPHENPSASNHQQSPLTHIVAASPPPRPIATPKGAARSPPMPKPKQQGQAVNGDKLPGSGKKGSKKRPGDALEQPARKRSRVVKVPFTKFSQIKLKPGWTIDRPRLSTPSRTTPSKPKTDRKPLPGTPILSNGTANSTPATNGQNGKKISGQKPRRPLPSGHGPTTAANSEEVIAKTACREAVVPPVAAGQGKDFLANSCPSEALHARPHLDDQTEAEVRGQWHGKGRLAGNAEVWNAQAEYAWDDGESGSDAQVLLVGEGEMLW